MAPAAAAQVRGMVEVSGVRDRRDQLPWRRPGVGPWGILVSETMLAQTQAERVAERFPEFMERYPAPEVLAADTVGGVLRDLAGSRLPEAGTQLASQRRARRRPPRRRGAHRSGQAVGVARRRPLHGAGGPRFCLRRAEHADRHEHRARTRPPDRAQPSRTGGAADGRRPPRRRRVGRSPDVTGRREGSTCLHGSGGDALPAGRAPVLRVPAVPKLRVGAGAPRCTARCPAGSRLGLSTGVSPAGSIRWIGPARKGTAPPARPGRGRWLPPTSRKWPAGHTINLALCEWLPASSMTGCSPSTRLATGSLDPLTLGRSWLLGVSGRLDGLDDVVAECCSGADQLPSDGGSGTEVP